MNEARRTFAAAAAPNEHSLYGAMDNRSRRDTPRPGDVGGGRSEPVPPNQDLANGFERRLRQILDGLPVAIYTTDAMGLVTYANRAAADLIGRQPMPGVDRWSVAYGLMTPEGEALPPEASPMALTVREGRAVRNIEIVVARPDGTEVPVLPYPTPLTDRSGAVVGGVNMLLDISERKEAEAGQFGLLKELNHRVKNNMQMLLSLLSSAARESATVEARTVLADASRRVAVMGAVQQVLYSGDGAGTTYQADALLHAVATIATKGPAGPIDISVADSCIVLPNDTAVPVALMLNELLSNVARHAHNGGDQASVVRVNLARNGERFVLTVEDNGPGFDMDVTSSKRASGLGLVRGLARQLGGTLTVERDTGARCTVTFSDRSFH